MKVMGVEQPWASVIVSGGLFLLTNEKPTPKAFQGAPIAIWASLNTRNVGLAATEPFSNHYCPAPEDLRIGALVGTVLASSWCEITPAIAEHTRVNRPEQFAYGDWTPGRWAWSLTSPLRFKDPIPFPSHRPTVDESELPL